MSVVASMEIELEPSDAFDTIVEELSMGLARLGMRLVPGPDGHLTENDVEVGRIVSWQPGKKIVVEWHPANWKPEKVTRVELRFE